MLFVVYLCGCTDCFAHACFVEQDDAKTWAESNSKNPEGYIIKWLAYDQLPKAFEVW